MRIGAELAAKRGERGLSIDQVAASTRIRRDHLLALEADDYAQFAAPPPAQAGAPATAAASPAIQARPVVVGVRVTDSVWINVSVDGNPQYGDSGRTLPTGSVVYFTGLDVKITTGKASATFITIDGRNVGAMGVGVATREFSSQTSS